MSSYSEKDAAAFATAFNDLGHIAMAHPLDEVRRSKGDATLRQEFHDSATLVLQLVVREERVSPSSVPRAPEVKAALALFQDELRSIDFDDAASMARLKAHARQALSAFGFPLPD